MLHEVATAHKIEVPDGEVDGRLDDLAASQGMDAREMRRMAEQQGWREAIRAELAEERALDFLIAEATVEEAAEPVS